MNVGRFRCCLLLAALVSTAILLPAPAQEVVSGYAFVEPDGVLRIAGYRIRLYGIYIPPTDQTCLSFVRPVPCGPRAVLALEFKISGDFVRCVPRAAGQHDIMVASCRSGDDELSEWLLQRGWAISLPDAPFEYAAMEKIARARGLGLWGIPAEPVPSR